MPRLFDRNALGKVPGTVHVKALLDSYVVREQLQRDDRQNTLQDGSRQNVVSGRLAERLNANKRAVAVLR